MATINLTCIVRTAGGYRVALVTDVNDALSDAGMWNEAYERCAAHEPGWVLVATIQGNVAQDNVTLIEGDAASVVTIHDE